MSPDDTEWTDQANWYLGRQLYFARRDSRVFVPKAHGPDRFKSQTLNFARVQSWLLLAMLMAPPAFMLLAFNAGRLPRLWREMIERVGGATAFTLVLFAATFLYYGIKRVVRRRRERAAAEHWELARRDKN